MNKLNLKSLIISMRNLLKESAKNDARYRKLAENYFEEVRDFVDFESENLRKMYSADVDGFITVPSLLDRKYSDLYVIFTDKIKGKKMAKAAYAQSKDKEKNFIILPILQRPFGKEHLTGDRMVGMKESFIHEFIHYMDARRYEGNLIPSADLLDKSKEDYFNSWQETNAYYQGAAFELTKFIDATATKIEPRRPGFLKSKYLGSFDLFWNKALSILERESDFMKYINDDNKKRLRKRFYGLYVDLVQKYEDLLK